MADENKVKIAQTLFGHGSTALQKQNFGYAVECFGKCTKLVPDNLVYRQSLRGAERKLYKDNKKGATMAAIKIQPAMGRLKIAKARKKWIDVIQAAEDALQINPWDTSAHYELANAALESDLIKVAVWTAEQGVELDRENPKMHRLLAEALERDGQYERAVRAWEKVRQLDPSDHEASSRARQMAASATIERGKYEESGDFRQSLADAAKTDELLDEARGGAESFESRTRKEIAELEAKAEADPGDTGNYVQIGNLYRKLREWESAAKAYQKGLDASGGTDNDIKILLMDCHIEPYRERLDLIKDRSEKLDKKAPDAAAKFKKLKEQYTACRNEIIRRELDLYRFRTDIDKDDTEAQYELGYRLVQIGKFDDAIKALQKGRNDPDHKWEALCWLGFAFWKKSNFPLAAKNLAEAFEALPKNDEDARKLVWYYQGCVAQERGDIDSARDFFNEIAAIDYEYKDVAKRLDELTGN